MTKRYQKSKVSWDYSYGTDGRILHHSSMRDGDDMMLDEPSPMLPIPNREKMASRWAFRQGIREETLQHRRIHRHGGLGGTGRNIAFVLQDRQTYGSRKTIWNQQRRAQDIARTNNASENPASARTLTAATNGGFMPGSKKRRQDEDSMNISNGSSCSISGDHNEAVNNTKAVPDTVGCNGTKTQSRNHVPIHLLVMETMSP